MWGKTDDSNRSSRDCGEVAGGSEGDLREAGSKSLSGRNGGARAGPAGDGSARRKPIGSFRSDLGKFYDREVYRQAGRRFAPRLLARARFAGGRRASEKGRHTSGLGGD